MYTPRLLSTMGVLVALACTFPSIAPAQTLDEFERSRYNVAAYYRYEKRGDLTLQATAYGNVRYPGLYEVPVGTTVSELFALAGGPNLTERRTQDRRTLIVRLYRGEGAASQLVHETVMENDLVRLQADEVLQPGDVLTVDSAVRSGLLWREIVPFVATGVSILAVILQLTR